MYGTKYTVRCDREIANVYIDETLKFSFSVGARVETDLKGNITAIYITSPNPMEFSLIVDSKSYTVNAKPNEKYVISNGKIIFDSCVPFDYKL